MAAATVAGPASTATAVFAGASRCVAEDDRDRWAAELVVVCHSSLRVTSLPGRGRGLVATTAIPQGTLLLRERPLVAVPAQEYPTGGKISEECVTKRTCTCLFIMEEKNASQTTLCGALTLSMSIALYRP